MRPSMLYSIICPPFVSRKKNQGYQRSDGLRSSRLPAHRRKKPEASDSSSAVISSHGFERVVLPSTSSTLGFSCLKERGPFFPISGNHCVNGRHFFVFIHSRFFIFPSLPTAVCRRGARRGLRSGGRTRWSARCRGCAFFGTSRSCCGSNPR